MMGRASKGSATVSTRESIPLVLVEVFKVVVFSEAFNVLFIAKDGIEFYIYNLSRWG